MITGITRVRNESLILEDTLRHFARYCDNVVLYDDCSTDSTVEIAQDMGCTVIQGHEWLHDRVAENTRHRKLCFDAAVSMGADWCLCFDADERLVGDLPDLEANGYTFRLFDGYMTPEHRQPYAGGKLENLPRLWGPEYRDIRMLFRADPRLVKWSRPGMRQPLVRGRVGRCDVLVKHYGKCLSAEQWDDNCRYYQHRSFPAEWRIKWKRRTGKAIHTRSDFGTPLHEWEDVAAHGVRL